MSNRQLPSHATHRSPDARYSQRPTYQREDASEPYRGPVGPSLRDPNQTRMNSSYSNTGRNTNDGRDALHATGQERYMVEGPQEAYRIQGLSPQNAHMRTFPPPSPFEVAYSHTGAQFTIDQNTSHGQYLDSPHPPYSGGLDSTYIYTGSHPRSSSGIQIPFISSSRERGFSPSNNYPSYDLNDTKVPPTVNDLPEEEPWTHLKGNSGPIPPERQPALSSSASPYYHQNHASPIKFSLYGDNMPSTATFGSSNFSRYQQQRANDSGSAYSLVHTNVPAVSYGQGRREKLESLVNDSHERSSGLHTRTSSRPSNTPITPSTGDFSDRQQNSETPLRRRLSGQTSNTTTSFTTQGSRKSKKGSSHQDQPEPLPCPECEKTFTGNDQKTNLTRHQNTVHHGHKSLCKPCGKVLSRGDNLKRHKKICKEAVSAEVHQGKKYIQQHQMKPL